HYLPAGHGVRVGPHTLTPGAAAHAFPASAYRVDGDGGGSLVYSGDTAPCPALTRLAEGCDVLLCEAEGDRPPGDGEQPVHHTPEDAGDTAAAAGAARLIVTHVGRALGPGHAVARAATRFAGPVEHADPGAVFTVA
ncbi:MBL fold metallo-hydrolase, partial [Streptomyces sp. NPDC058734]|uniref:MBL fold metallo-hydrolase n=1 Tax=Streptomyces sp. NPDC058734 TaxID=3346615 RepID=UPI00367DF124